MKHHLCTKLCYLFLDDRGKRILYPAVVHFVSGCDYCCFSDHERLYIKNRSVIAYMRSRLQLILFYDKRYNSCSGELITLFHSGIAVPCGYHHFTKGVDLFQLFAVHLKQSVTVSNHLYLAFLYSGWMHFTHNIVQNAGFCGFTMTFDVGLIAICATCAHTIKHLCCLIFVHHGLIIFPYIYGVFSDAKQHRYILFCYNMPLAKNRILFHIGDNLCDIVAEHLSDCLRCLHKLHIIPHSKYYFCK